MEDVKLLSDVRNQVHEWFGIALTDEQLESILANPKLGPAIKRWGVDTVTRELIGDYIAREVTGMSWPTYGIGEEAKRSFFEVFEKKAKEKGYALT